MADSFSNPTPQFSTAEYLGSAAGAHCQICDQSIAGDYYRVNSSVACARCASTARGQVAKDTHAAYTRALLYGVGAAIAGMILYAVFEIATGIIIGYVSLAVGWLVGKAMMKGSAGVGGRRYQVAAALLTYAAVSLAAVPVILHYANKHQQQLQNQRQRLQDEQRQLESESGQVSPQSAPRPSIKLSALVGNLALFGLASPFLELRSNPLGGLIGLVILFVGMRIAVRLTAESSAIVFGPFHTGVPTSS